MVDYNINTASAMHVFSHLKSCDESFLINLAKKVDIEIYSKKIKSHAVLFEAWVNELLIGLLAVYYNNHKDKVAYITNVSVSKDYENQGVASELMKRCLAYSIDFHFKVIKLEVAIDNQKAIRFYRKFDFIQSGYINNNILMERTI